MDARGTQKHGTKKHGTTKHGTTKHGTTKHGTTRRAGRAVVTLTGSALAGLTGLQLTDIRAIMADPKADDLIPGPPREEHVVRSADGTAIAVQIHGRENAPTVVLIHGWTCNAEFWTPQVRALSRDLRIVTYDQRGHGASGQPGRHGYAITALADDLAAVLTTCVPAGQRAVIAGHSMGGFATLAFAGRHHGMLHDRVAGVLLASTAGGQLLAESRVLPGRRLPTAVRVALSRALMSSTLPTGPSSPLSRRVNRYIALSPAASPAQVAFADRIITSCPRTTRGWCGAQTSTLDLDTSVARLDIPTIIVVGTVDRLTPLAQSRRLAEKLPDLLDIVELPGVGHLTPLEAPAVVNDLIRRLADRYLPVR